MPGVIGSFVNSGPVITIRVGGFAPTLAQDFQALIDTGYTGFLSMPLVRAFPLGLILFGTTSLVLADGSTSYRLTAYGSVALGNENQNGVIVLETGSDELLLGVGFLSAFRKRLIVCPTSGLVELVDAPPSATPSPAQQNP
jgi:predicted aspartyl protease